MFNALSTGVTGFIGAGVKAAKDTIPTIPNPIGGGDKDEEDEMNALEAAANAKNPRPPPRSNEGDDEDDRASVASSGATSGADSPVSGAPSISRVRIAICTSYLYMFMSRSGFTEGLNARRNAALYVNGR